MWEKTMPINEVRELRGKTNIFLGVGAIEKIFDIAKEIKEKGIDKVAIVTGKSSYVKCGAWHYIEKALKENHIEFVLYNKVTPNPLSTQVDGATKMARELGAKAVIGIGGGSPIDTAKSVAIMTLYPEYTTADLYEYNFIPTKSLPVIAINTTHGTGTEADRFAVVSVLEDGKEYKPAIAYDFSYPMYSIDDPKLMVSLPKSQTAYTSIDAINHVVEACTTAVTTPYAVMLAKETVRLMAKYLPNALENGEDLEARYYLTYASTIAGICFDNGMLHLTHALEHPLSAIKPDLAHGLGLAMLLPAVVRNIYSARPEVLADVLSPIVPELKGTKEEAEKAANGVREWLEKVGVKETLTDLGFKEEHIEKLVELVFTTPSLDLLLGCSPIPPTKELVEKVYRESL
ncbi:iron-containing alcohol dehydrogenase [Paramaledivibacter caminithermalis]|uniref:Alcohol dehydrogenase, class IV n=1 Tax=Paramaledivibacter caminithermalis (strain DSM 15212 / CIP 107654 / DViRD3) TaxID=1121301 RepID=A0A1M6TJN4_PARC5|nr:iron-containing alcohol dehydrogenase [Paramaledivibacter caminithermalis]SHK57144.1 Alcohol dehydrogenase, class IV [Paramaledivibacter caminithermalis DSM 15212]